MTQTQIAKKCGCTQQAVSKINAALTKIDAFNTKGIPEGAAKLLGDISSNAATIMVRRGIAASEIGSKPVEETTAPKPNTINLNDYEVVQ